MFSNGYMAVGRRCAVCPTDLGLPFNPEEILLRLELKEFRRIDVDLAGLVQLCLKRSEYERGARIELAPEVVDCSSLVKWLYGQIGIWLPRHSINQRQMGHQVEIHELEPWDLVFTRGTIPYFIADPAEGIGHVGIVAPTGKVLHAANTKQGIIEVDAGDFTNKLDFQGAVRIIKPGTVTLESVSGRRPECSWDFRCYVLQTLDRINST